MNRVSPVVAVAVLLLLDQGASRAQEAGKNLGLPPEDVGSPVHPRKFGLPGGIGVTRGWYVWRSFDAKTWQAEVSHEGSKEIIKTRVLPWLTTYRHLVYGAHPDELRPGERVNLFFNPSDKERRAYLVHFQDELCQMKGHNHAWQIVETVKDGFKARVVAGDKPLDDKVAVFTLDPRCKVWQNGTLREGKPDASALAVGAKVYLTWTYADNDQKRLVRLRADAGSLDAIQKAMKKQVEARVAREGMTGLVEDAGKDKARLLVFATWWQQASTLKPKQELRVRATDASLQPVGEAVRVRLVSRKNLGTYGSGCSEMWVEPDDVASLDVLRRWSGGKIVRVFAD